jgi:hypothetical protein
MRTWCWGSDTFGGESPIANISFELGDNEKRFGGKIKILFN